MGNLQWNRTNANGGAKCDSNRNRQTNPNSDADGYAHHDTHKNSDRETNCQTDAHRDGPAQHDADAKGDGYQQGTLGATAHGLGMQRIVS